jgi:hypothetical protein
MQRSLNAVIVGTFTLRFSTGLTGGVSSTTSPTCRIVWPERRGHDDRLPDRPLLRRRAVPRPPFGLLSDQPAITG